MAWGKAAFLERVKGAAQRAISLLGAGLRRVSIALWRLLVLIAKGLHRLPPISWAMRWIARRTKPLTDEFSRYATVWQAAWEAQKREEPLGRPTGKAIEFLPAVLEIQEAPPSPAGRKTAFAIVGVFTVAILWASFGKIDIVAVGQGKIIPSDYSKVIQPLESGVIKAIHVRNGQTVKRGDVLIELDPTVVNAEEERLTNEQLSAKVEAARLSALLKGKARLEAPKGADPRFVSLQQQMLQDQLSEHEARLESARLLVEQRQAALEGTKINIQRLEMTVPMLNERADAYKKLAAEKFVSHTQYLELEAERVDKVQELAGQRHRLVQDTAALAEARKNYQAIRSEFKKERLEELSALETKAASLSQEVVKAGQRTSYQRLTAPIDGIVQQLAVHTLGGVVTPAQELMVVVPNEHQLEVEAWIENKDIGFVYADQVAEVKIETFPFTRYGTIDATVLTVSQDAVPLDKVGHVYAARVALHKSQIQVEEKLLNLSPGMNVTVEIKTGQRRLIEYFLSPLLRYKDESVRER
jgi:hemolysin D